MISITGLSKSSVLAALYNAARPQGMGFLQYDPTPMTDDEAKEILAESSRFDYLKGRVLKVDLSGDTFEERLYDRDNGTNAAAIVIAALRATGDPNTSTMVTLHKTGRKDAARIVSENLTRKTQTEERDGITVVKLGYEDVQNVLRPRLAIE